jgi:hypothetical protein
VKRKKQQLKLSWKGIVAIGITATSVTLLCHHFKREELARPIVFSIIIIGIALAMLWQRRRGLGSWFWIALTIFVLLHVLFLVLLWISGWAIPWIPAFMITPIALADSGVMLATLSVIAKFCGKPTSER